MSGNVTLYMSSVTSSAETRKHQAQIESVLAGLKIDFQKVDVSSDRAHLEKMREIVGDSTALAPQLCNGDQYLGNYDAFELAVEDKKVEEFLKL